MTENALQKLSQAEKWLAEAKDLEDLREIHDIALAAEAYAKARRLGIDSENHAREIKFLAARRIGELVPGEGHGGKREKGQVQNADLIIPKQRLSDFRKLAEVPIEKFKERIEVAKAKEEKITYNRIFRGDWYQMSETPEWETPQWLFDLLNKEFHFNLDVCASEVNHKCEKYFSKEDDGLAQNWHGICWMNPPYGREIAKWMAKARRESENGCFVVCLVAARTDSEWWWEYCISAEIRFLKGRLKFGNVSGNVNTSPFPSAVIVLRRDIKQKTIWWDVHSNDF